MGTAGAIRWWKVVLGIVLTVVALMLPYQNNPEMNHLFGRVLYLAIAAMGLNLLTGFNGQVSIGHGAFFGVGAFTAAILVSDHGWYLEATIPVAALLAGLLGVAVGFPALRVRGAYLALVTLGLAVLFPKIINRFFDGSARVKRRDVQSLIPSIPNDIYQYYVCLGLMVLLFALAYNLTRSRMGRAMIAVRDQEVAASTVGVDVSRVKIATFALSAAYAGVAGALSILINRTASASNPLLYFQLSIEFLIAVVIGGTATIVGPLAGAIMLVAIRRSTEDTEALAPTLLGGILILVVYVLPDGLVGGLHRLAARFRQRRASSPDVPPDPSPSPATPNQIPA